MPGVYGILSLFCTPLALGKSIYKERRSMTREQKVSYIEYLKMKADLSSAYEQGTMLLLDGMRVLPADIAGACVFREENIYMKAVSDDMLKFEHMN